MYKHDGTSHTPLLLIYYKVVVSAAKYRSMVTVKLVSRYGLCALKQPSTSPKTLASDLVVYLGQGYRSVNHLLSNLHQAGLDVPPSTAALVGATEKTNFVRISLSIIFSSKLLAKHLLAEGSSLG